MNPVNPPGNPENIDPGLAGERTALAWHRTAIAFAAAGGAMIKIWPAAGLTILAISGLIWQLPRLSRVPGARSAGSNRHLLITAAVAGISVGALIISFVGHSPGWLR